MQGGNRDREVVCVRPASAIDFDYFFSSTVNSQSTDLPKRVPGASKTLGEGKREVFILATYK